MSAAPGPDLDGIAALRTACWNGGYRPLSVYSYNHADRDRAGKAPLGPNWRERALRDPPEVVTLPAVPHAANTGLLCDGLRALDIDVDDKTLAAQVCELARVTLGDTLIRSRENSGRCLLPYRAATGSPRKRILAGLLGKLEILGEGQQFVSHGIHPTGAPLRWAPVGPEQMAVENLPAVTEEQIIDFFRTVAPLIEAEPPEPEPVPGGKSKSNGQDGPHFSPPPQGNNAALMDILDVMAALAVIPNDAPANWEHWNNVGMAVWLATRASVHGFNAWYAWSAKHPAFDEAKCRKRWDHYPKSPPDRTGAGKLYAMAAKALPGWQRPSEIRRQEDAAWAALDPLQRTTIDPVGKEQIPPRSWVYGNFLLAGSASVIGAVDGGGKGAIAVVMALAMITGLPLLGEPVRRTGPVAIIFYEDDLEEWHRRIAAACAKHQVDYATVLANIHFIERPGSRVSFARLNKDGVVFPDGDAIITHLRDIGAVLLIIDPFNHCHELDDGNSNVMIAKVAGEVARIAKASGAAVLVLHHLRKGATGQPDDLMGATSLRATFRSARILARMTVDQAKDMKIPNHWRYIRIAGSKENYAPPPDQATWFQLVSVPLGNTTAEYLTGDNVAVAATWHPRPMFEGMDGATLAAVFEALRTTLHSPHKQAKNWAGKVLMDIGGRSKAEAGKIIAAWVENGVLVKDKYYQVGANHKVDKVVLNEQKVAEILAETTYQPEPDRE